MEIKPTGIKGFSEVYDDEGNVKMTLTYIEPKEKEKSAKEMFEELGYRKFNYSKGIRYTNEHTEQNIEFEEDGFINIYNTCCDMPNDIEVLIVEELKAINKQVEELGWDNE